MDYLSSLFGTNIAPRDLGTLQVSARALVMFIAALVLIRLGDRRFLSPKSAFDTAVGFILASMLARAVNGSASIVPTLAGGLVIVLLHRVLASLASKFHFVGRLLKGRSDLIIQDGALIPERLKANALSEGDVLEDVRLNGKVAEVSDVRAAYFERNGKISVIVKK